MRKKKEIVVRLDDDDEERERPVPATAFKRGEPNPHQWTKGTSGNPSGRPRDAERRLVSKALRVRLACRAPNKVSEALGIAHGSSWAQCLAASLMVRAIKGDTQASRLILEYVEPQATRLEFGAMTDQDGNLIPPPNLVINFNHDLAPGVDPATYRPELYLDRTTPPLLPEPRDCRAD